MGSPLRTTAIVKHPLRTVLPSISIIHGKHTSEVWVPKGNFHYDFAYQGKMYQGEICAVVTHSARTLPKKLKAHAISLRIGGHGERPGETAAENQAKGVEMAIWREREWNIAESCYRVPEIRESD